MPALSIKRGVGLCVLMFMLATSGRPAAAADPAAPAVLDMAPANAPALVVISNLSKFEQKLGELEIAAGLPAFGGIKPVQMLKRQLGFDVGLNPNGSLLWAVTSLDGVGAPAAPAPGAAPVGENDVPTVLIVPVNDFAAFVTALGGKPGAGVVSITLPPEAPAFVKQFGDYAVMSHQKSVVEKYQPGRASAAISTAAGKLGTRYLATSDVAVYLDSPQVLRKLGPIMETMMMALPQDGNGGVMNMALASLQEASRAVLKETTALVLGLDVGNLGIGATMAAQFKPGSYLSQVLKSNPAGAGGAAAFLDRLPQTPYMLAGSIDLGSIGLERIITDLTAGADKQNPSFKMVEQWLATMKGTKGVSMLYAVPQVPMLPLGASPLIGLTVIETDDPAAYVKSYRAVLEQMGKNAANANPGAAPQPNDPAAPQDQGVQFITQYTPNAQQVDGVSADHYQIIMNLPPAMMQNVGPFMMMLGMTRSSGFIAATDKHVITTSTDDVELLRKGLAAAKAGKGLGNGAIMKQVRTIGLPPNPSAELYISVSGIVETVSKLFIAQDANLPKPPANLPPIALGMSVQDQGMATRLYVPTPVMVYLKELTANMQLPALPGPGGRPGPPRAPF